MKNCKVLLILPLLVFSSCARDNPSSDKEIINKFYQNFLMLTEIPRPSKHEKRISDFLKSWSTEKGYTTTQDSYNNIIFDVTATSGYENLPFTALQVHMDMVCVGMADPLNDPIHPIRDDKKEIVYANGTSLGADDGAGIATIMTYLESGQNHGPLRVFITTDEEMDFSGANNMNPDYFKDLKYLINVDAEDSTSMCVSTASAVDIIGAKNLSLGQSSKNTSIKLTLSGLKGGHSGVDIDKNRCNAIMELGQFLVELSDNNIDFDIAKLEGGEFSNSIPKQASSVLFVDSGTLSAIESLKSTFLNHLKEKYSGEDSIVFDISQVNVSNQVISNSDTNDLINMFDNIQNGVYTMSPDLPTLVECSCNLGRISFDNSVCNVAFLLRSSSQQKEDELLKYQESVLTNAGFSYTISRSTKAWPYNPNNKLINIAKEVYKKQNETDLDVVALHAGLECGTFATYNPNLMMCAIGPDIHDAHSVDETLYLNSIPKVYKLLSEMLLRVN